jgi:O-antigen/teichoic acid export membrane protein
MALARKLAYNVVFNAFAKIASTALALVAIGFITRSLGKEGFGDYATVLAFFGFFNSFADLGLQTVAAREISRAEADEAKIMGSVLALRLLTSAFVLALTPALLAFLPYSAELKLGILVAAAAFVFSSTSMVLNGVFQKHLVMDRVATIELAGKVIQLGVIAAAVRLDLGFLAVVLSLLAYMFFNAVAIFWMSRRYVAFSLHIDREHWKAFLRQSLPVGAAAVITFAYFKMDTILLSFLRSSAEVGVYNVAYKVIENLTFFPAMVAGLVLPVMSRLIFSDRRKFEIVANKTFKVFLTFVVPIVIGGFFLAPHIVSIIGGPGFSESAGALRILVFALAFIFFGHFFNSILIVGNLQKKLMVALAAAAALNLALNAILIPRYSYMGAAAVSVFTEMLVVSCSFILARKYVRYRPSVDRSWSIFLSGGVMAAFLAAFPGLPLAVLILGSAAIYLGFLWLTNGIGRDEIASLFGSGKENVPSSAE